MILTLWVVRKGLKSLKAEKESSGVEGIKVHVPTLAGNGRDRGVISAVFSRGSKVMKLMVQDLLGDYRTATAQEILTAADHVINRRFRRGFSIQSVAESKNLFRQKLAARENEAFAVLFLDNKNRVIEYEEMFYGTIDSASVHARVIVQRALALNAAAVIVAHNHPSGEPEPSRADETLTLRLKEALALVEVRLLDHIVVGERCISLAERGLM